MGTRGVIARRVNGGFVGVYHHWDSYPSGLGKTLFDLYRAEFGKDLPLMLTTLIDEHPAGWSTINGKDFTLLPGYVSMDDVSPEEYKKKTRPQCYCHGARHERAFVVTEKNASASGCEYAYVFDVATKRMAVLSSYTEIDNASVKMIGAFGCGDPDADWRTIAIVDLEDDTEPNWEAMK